MSELGSKNWGTLLMMVREKEKLVKNKAQTDMKVSVIHTVELWIWLWASWSLYGKEDVMTYIVFIIVKEKTVLFSSDEGGSIRNWEKRIN